MCSPVPSDATVEAQAHFQRGMQAMNFQTDLHKCSGTTMLASQHQHQPVVWDMCTHRRPMHVHSQAAHACACDLPFAVVSCYFVHSLLCCVCYTEKAPNAWQRRGTQKTRNTYNQPNRPFVTTQSAQPTNLTDQAPSTTERTARETHNTN